MAPVPIYQPDERSKAHHQQELVQTIINDCPILHVSFTAPLKSGPPFPTILPMLGAIGQSPDDDEPHIYLHGSSVARLFKLTSGGEVALSVCATILDGYVMALAPFHNSCNYRSAVAFGYGQLIDDQAEIEFALRLITNNSMPERWENSRSPPTKVEFESTGVLKVRIETASAKVRAGGPSDDKPDMTNADVADKTWVGVVPAYQTLGEPVAAEYNRVKEVPEYIADWVADANSINEQRAIDAMEESG
ncbi:hypothetical protein BDY17DRAFT_311119 [Neohortaea acidophila]|uniref:Flavin-nucleotide-binding protein n=1 Tax=Neohortaea acidophila TaxID=245834 RepID=A0A6A6PSC9_9PEZI|nr:uncharacterized protein BDY17DRAFT_311119 [Neohortaea acidophila]KAF2482686.1 hypothetical protein BDY17DRAFT_311119 [Neohortaea acidophila]